MNNTFTMPVNDHLDIPLQEPIFITVKHILGYATEVTLPPSLIPFVKDVKELCECIQAAAMNNFKSITDEQ